MRNQIAARTCRSLLAMALAFALLMGRAEAATLAPPQQTFASADAAAAALATAARAGDQAALRGLFGPGSEALVSSGDRSADRQAERRFAVAYDAKHVLVPDGADRMTLEVGDNAWPLPIPIVRAGDRWRFDTAVGAQEIVDRRIGRNELAAIHVALTVVDAQKDYFDRMRQATGAGSYAQRLISTAGKQDGLYWPASGSAPESPLGPFMAEASREQEGYPSAAPTGALRPYKGYYFRILKAQGDNAPGGAMDYVKAGAMRGGFALVAWPVSYGASGIMTFQVNQDGVVFQKDLGAGTPQLVRGMTRFDPDLSWARVKLADQ